VPVINENDSVATTEIRFGDNDRLAARVGQAAEADGVILLSDVDGLYDRDPTVHADARRVERVERIDRRIVEMGGPGTSSGMASKREAARIATAAGAAFAIVSGKHDRPLARFAAGGCGTVFAAAARPSARKSWIAGRLTVRGRISIDEGAARALGSGKSLLP